MTVIHPELQNFSAFEWISLSGLAEGFIQVSVEREKTLWNDGACEYRLIGHLHLNLRQRRRCLAQVRYTQPAQEVTLMDCLNEVEHMSARVKRLEEAILEVVKQAPQAMQELIRGLQALRGVAHISAVTIAAELGNTLCTERRNANTPIACSLADFIRSEPRGLASGLSIGCHLSRFCRQYSVSGSCFFRNRARRTK